MPERPMTSEELSFVADLGSRAILAIERQNYTDTPMTDEEKNVIEMAVSWTFREMTRYARSGRN